MAIRLLSQIISFVGGVGQEHTHSGRLDVLAGYVALALAVVDPGVRGNIPGVGGKVVAGGDEVFVAAAVRIDHDFGHFGGVQSVIVVSVVVFHDFSGS